MRVGLDSSNLKNVDPREMRFNLMEEIVEVNKYVSESLLRNKAKLLWQRHLAKPTFIN